MAPVSITQDTPVEPKAKSTAEVSELPPAPVISIYALSLLKAIISI